MKMSKKPFSWFATLFIVLATGTGCGNRGVSSCETGTDHTGASLKRTEQEALLASEPSFVRYSRKFRPTLIRAGNSVEGYQGAREAKVRFAESDFMMSTDGVIVSTHDAEMGGTCGHVKESTMAELSECSLKGGTHVATLSDFLALPLDEWFIDLKDSKDEALTLEVVEKAIREIQRLGRQDGAIVMIYSVPEGVSELIADNGIRAAMKGYPKKKDEIMNLVKEAVANQFEMVCIKLKYLTPEIVRESARLGIWHLAWDTGKSVSRWRELAQSGLGGVITEHEELAKSVAKCFRPALEWSVGMRAARKPQDTRS